MKTIHSLTLILFAFMLLNSTTIQAQDTDVSEDHIFVVVTWETMRPEDGTVAEMDSLMTLYQSEVINKNELIISEKNLRHLYGSNSSDWIVITEYANWNDVEAAGKMNDELFLTYWATPEERRAFNKAFGKYFGSHSDEIYTSLAKFSK